MTLLERVLDLLTIGLPEIVGEFVSGLLLTFGRGRWQAIASGPRAQAEDTVRRLRRHRVSAWVHPAKGHAYEVVVKTRQAEAARALLDAPSSGRRFACSGAKPRSESAAPPPISTKQTRNLRRPTDWVQSFSLRPSWPWPPRLPRAYDYLPSPSFSGIVFSKSRTPCCGPSVPRRSTPAS
jgi:hypothetical protein